jgi:lysostaphin
MNIKLQLKNFAKLLLIGVVLFVICSAVSKQAIKCVSAKSNSTCQADLAKDMFAQSDKQAKPESPSYLMVGVACVKAAVPPIAVTSQVLGAIVGDSQEEDINSDSPKTIIEYQVEQNDTISSLAEKFNVSADTIIWANNLKKGVQLNPGQTLIVPPVTGIVHYVAAGDTVANIAEKYKAKSDDIVAFNGLSGENDIFIGDTLIIPDGEMPQAIILKPSSGNPQNLNPGTGNWAAMPNDYFLCPVGFPCKKSQGLHFRNAADLTAYCGAPIYAAASGTVTKTKAGGWNGGAGNNISVSHFGGTVITHYYHLQTIMVSQGQEVKKGDVIGLMGSTGNSTGCHLHFEVIGAINPFVR